MRPAFQAREDVDRYARDVSTVGPKRGAPGSQGLLERDPSVRPGAWREAMIVLAVAAGVLLCGKEICGKMFHSVKGIGWETPQNSYSINAARATDEHFPARMRGGIVMAIEAVGNTSSALTDVVAEFSRNVSRGVKEDNRVSPYAPVVLGYYLGVGGYRPSDDFMKEEFVSADQRMTTILIQPTQSEGNWRDANQFLQEYCASPPPGYVLHITGIPAVLGGDGCFAGFHERVNTRDMNFECLFRTEICTLPMALLIMGYIVKHAKLLLLPLFTVAVSFIVSAFLLVPWMDTVPIPGDTCAIMFSVTMAFCLDYSLFILSRFSEQYAEGQSLQQNIDKIRKHTNRTIAVSGFLVAVALFGSIMLPQRAIQGAGLGMGIAILSCIATSTTLTPAMLLVFSRALVGASSMPTRLGDQQLQGYVDQEETSDLVGASRRRSEEKSNWVVMSKLVDRSPIAALAVVLFVTGPLLVSFSHINITGDAFAMLPMDMPAIQALRRVQSDFPVGILEPFSIMITAPETGRDGVDVNQEVVDALASVKDHDVQASVSQLGLDPAEARGVSDLLANAATSLGAAPATEEAPKDALAACRPASRVDAAVKAGSALADARAQGADAAGASRAALRAASSVACNSTEALEATVAAASLLHPRSTVEVDKAKYLPEEATIAMLSMMHRGGLVNASGKLDDEVELAQAVAAETRQQGLDQTGAAQVSMAAAKGELPPTLHPDVIAAARAGAVARAARARGQSGGAALRESLRAVEHLELSPAEAARLLLSLAGSLDLRPEEQNLRPIITAAVAAVERAPDAAAAAAPADASAEARHAADEAKADAAEANAEARKRARAATSVALAVGDAIANMSSPDKGRLLLPSGFDAMLQLCDEVRAVGNVSSMLGPTWAYHNRVDWATAVGMHAMPSVIKAYQMLLDSHTNGRRALLEVHTTFPSIGAGAANWVLEVREVLRRWEEAHPGFQAVLSGGASEAADIRDGLMGALWSYLSVSVTFIMFLVYYSFKSIMVPFRLAIALVFTIIATFGTGVIVYQTPLLHPYFPFLRDFDGITYEVVPLVTGVAIALGLDYDIFLVSRIVEFRLNRFSDRASVFRGVFKTGDVISGAGLIMALAFTGLCSSNKLLFQQFGVLLITSVLLDTFVVRTVFVPALMLIAQDWNWWPRDMPPAIHDVLQGEVESSGGLSKPIMEGVNLGGYSPLARQQEEWIGGAGSGMIA